VEVAVAGNQSIVGVEVIVCVAVAVAGSGGAGRRISHPDVRNKTLRIRMAMTNGRRDFFRLNLLISRS
jgi:hypothetical protein